jgi:hypothetical protein
MQLYDENFINTVVQTYEEEWLPHLLLNIMTGHFLVQEAFSHRFAETLTEFFKHSSLFYARTLLYVIILVFHIF